MSELCQKNRRNHSCSGCIMNLNGYFSNLILRGGRIEEIDWSIADIGAYLGLSFRCYFGGYLEVSFLE